MQHAFLLDCLLNKLINNLESLNLNMFRANIDTYLELISKGEKDIVDSLYELTQYEVTLKQERAITSCVRVANFPFIKTLDDFDFGFQPSVNKDELMNFRYLKFIENKENILFIGSPGVGKTHLATSVGIEAAKSRKSTYFISCNDLILQLKRAQLENRLETSKPLSKWGEIFCDSVIANAILDRLLHHSHIINIVGKSYRTKDKLESITPNKKWLWENYHNWWIYHNQNYYWH